MKLCVKLCLTLYDFVCDCVTVCFCLVCMFAHLSRLFAKTDLICQIGVEGRGANSIVWVHDAALHQEARVVDDREGLKVQDHHGQDALVSGEGQWA